MTCKHLDFVPSKLPPSVRPQSDPLVRFAGAGVDLLQRSLPSVQLVGPWKPRSVRFERASPVPAPLEPSHLCRCC